MMLYRKKNIFEVLNETRIFGGNGLNTNIYVKWMRLRKSVKKKYFYCIKNVLHT